ncbi:glycosyltransferase family 1 protein [Chlorobaculum sp. MV4-Y]|uniref:glycosyltransferase family 4 protein n=1 Tax=Chlorobaculum sp. MV4-Y TaxID=2976335 RepID=UPI0021AEFFBA|nr:glycosyltransferase family 1 protein [Chlorobaculum sp. MV4-Y]UWX57290.1 glycosyltransferase family 1 protein [Chlorobaculum sp. MV4-Y]
MKVALYAGTYVKDKDGAVRSIYQLVSSMIKNGHEVVVWTPDFTPGANASVPVNLTPSVPIPLYPDYKLGFYNAVTERQLDEFAPDIVHISTPDIVGRKFLHYAKRKGIPVGSAYHTDFPSYLSYYHLGFAEPAIWNFLRKFYNACDVTLAPNESVRERLTGKGIEKVELWSRGIDKELFDPSRRSAKLRRAWDAEGRTVIIYAGRFVLYKDIEVVMSLYERFVAEGLGERVRFVMIGSGPEEAEMRARMPDAVFTGYLTGTALPEAYASGDLFLFPSTTEAFCNVTLEALATGLPAVVSDVGGCQELVERSGGGFVAKAGDISDFYKCCTKLMQDGELFRAMRERGLAFAEDKSWAAVNGKLIDRYLELIATKARQ